MEVYGLRVTPAFVERFLSKVDCFVSGDACWRWMASRTSNGYGQFAMTRSLGPRPAHRIAWMLFRHDDPAELEVCHRCDNPQCVRPSHLFLGTHQENMADMGRKCRNPSVFPKGASHPKAKLSEEAVRDIRSSSASNPELAAKYGVPTHVIRRARVGLTWRHVQ